MEDIKPERKPVGCGFLAAVFGRRTTSAGSVQVGNKCNIESVNTATAPPKTIVFETSPKGTNSSAIPNNKPHQNQHRQNTSYPQRKQTDQPAVVVSSSATNPTKVTENLVYVNQGKKLPKEAIGVSGELESLIVDHQKAKGSHNLVRASSSNVMLCGNLGNLRQPGGGGTAGAFDIFDQLPRNAREDRSISPTGNRKNRDNSPTSTKTEKPSKGKPTSLCKTISTRMDPETLKIMGNEDYKNGRFAEALALYDAAISIDPNKASYRSNKSAALTALGELLQAVFECREAIRIDPHYHRAHHRLANLYLRLGDAENAIYHFKHSGPEADAEDVAHARNLQSHLSKCTEARRLRDWNTLIKEAKSAVSAGADSAPMIFALQAEALLKLRRHEEAVETISNGPNFDVDSCTKFFGPIGNANLLVTRAQVDLAAGRFDEALEAVQKAARLDSNNREAISVLRKVRAVVAARSKGNELFKVSKFSEACNAYGEGLELDSYSSVLLCNRAACRSKLGQFDKALQDCNAALNLRPSYSKARLRRADCNAKMERWETAIQDYEVLLKETPDDEQVKQAMQEAQEQLKKRQA